MEVRLLGPLEVIDDAGDPIDVGGERPRALLVDLALERGHTVPADRLLDDAWGDEAPTRNTLQVTISRLRRALGSNTIATQAGGYVLDIPSEAVDVERFDRLAAIGRDALRAGDAAGAARALRSALALWRGTPLADVAGEEFARPVITRLEEARLATTEDRIDADLALGDHAALVGELEALVREHPVRERLWAQLMTALYRSGRQSEALHAYQRARTMLLEEFGIEPGPTLRGLERAVLAQEPELGTPKSRQELCPPPPRSGNLPEPPNELVGRTADLDAAANLVQRHRIATIVGTGGVGKTRLAVEVGRSLRERFADGVWLVDLAAAGASADVARTIASTLGAECEIRRNANTDLVARLVEFLTGRSALVVLDNCEHVVADVAPVVHELVARCGALHILATSREPLAVAGEALWPLAPLAPSDALQLFVARAADVAPGSCSDDETLATARGICQHLDGLPLAIELAAARMRVFTPADLLARLDDRFRILTAGPRTAAPRQQTLRAVVDWSHDLLGDDERTVFARASAFVGPFDLDAAEQVCCGDDVGRTDVADLLARLVDKSLVVSVEVDGHRRFRLLQTLAQYGSEQLRRTDEEHATRTRHARWVASFAEVADAEHGTSSRRWFARFTDAVGDVHAAMEWSLRIADPDLALAIGDGLGWYWHMGGRVEPTWAWLVGALDLGEPRVPARRVRALAWAGAIGVGSDTERAMAFGVEGVDRARELGDAPAWAHAAMRRGSVLADFWLQREAAAQLLEESEQQLLVGDAWSLAEAALLRGAVLLLRGDYPAAGVELRCSADRFQAIGNPWGAAIALRNLADVAIPSGRYDEAVAVLQEAISALHAVGAICISGALMARLAYVYGLQGRVAEADAWHERAMAAANEQRLAPVLGLTHNLRGDVLRRWRRLDEAEACHRSALALYRQHHDVGGAAYAHTSLGFVAELRDDAATAQQHHAAALAAAREIDDPRSIAAALEGMAGVASLRGDAERTGTLLGAATALRERMGVPLVAAERADLERAEARFSERSQLERAYQDGFSCADAVVKQAAQAEQAVS